MIARRDRPTSREISCVRPPIRPFTDSRSLRVFVDAGSMAYSAVTQPSPEPFRQRGTPTEADAAHNTRVFPNSTSTDPAAWSSQWRVIVIGRSSSLRRPSARVMGRPYPALPRGSQVRRAVVSTGSTAARGLVESDRVGGSGGGQVQLSTVDLPGLPLDDPRVVPGRDVGEHQPGNSRLGCGRTGLLAGQMQVTGVVVALDESGLAEEQVGPGGKVHQLAARPAVTGVHQHPVPGHDPHP